MTDPLPLSLLVQRRESLEAQIELVERGNGGAVVFDRDETLLMLRAWLADLERWEAALAEVRRPQPPRFFPIQGGPAIRWTLVEPHERQAMKNHGGQSLEELALRGGLGVGEAVAVLEDRPWRQMPITEAKAALQAYIDADLEAEIERLRARVRELEAGGEARRPLPPAMCDHRFNLTAWHHHEAVGVICSRCYTIRFDADVSGAAPGRTPRPLEPCVFASIEGVASCGTHRVGLSHVADKGWRCPASGVWFEFGAEFGTEGAAPGAVDPPPLTQDAETLRRVREYLAEIPAHWRHWSDLREILGMTIYASPLEEGK